MLKNFLLFTTKTCPKCPEVKRFMEETGLEGVFVDASTPEGLDEARKYSVAQVPTVIFFDENGKIIRKANNIDEIKEIMNKT